MTALSKRLDGLRARRTDVVSGAVLVKEAALRKAYLAPSAKEAREYIVEAAEPVDDAYTKKTFEECSRVENQLTEGLRNYDLKAQFDHQGSVTNNTHIKLYSDIDLLTLTTRFWFVKPPAQPTHPYQGNPLADLTTLRSASTASLKKAFPAATVDEKKSRCISIAGGSLQRKVDVVVCSWLETEASRSGDGTRLGIRVLDTDEPSTIENFPFLHNARLNEKDAATSGNLKRLIRVIKSIRSDADADIRFSSYDVAAVCYAIPAEKLLGGNALVLTAEFMAFGHNLLKDPAALAQLRVPNDTRLIFGGSEGASVDDFKKLVAEVYDTLSTATGSA